VRKPPPKLSSPERSANRRMIERDAGEITGPGPSLYALTFFERPSTTNPERMQSAP
jgi:hypothetical protein